MNGPAALLEICAGSVESALAAARAGARRIELCAALEAGGVTPGAGMIRAVKERLGATAVNVLVRPRGGDFLYTAAEKAAIMGDIRTAMECGADGIVVGALTRDGRIDVDFCRCMLAEAGGMDTTLHRAFDMCRDAEEALECAVSLGFKRILTSGQAATAELGTPLIAALVERAAGRISIMPGGGVNAGNARGIIAATGAREIHASAAVARPSLMEYRRAGVGMSAGPADEYSMRETSEGEARAIMAALEGR